MEYDIIEILMGLFWGLLPMFLGTFLILFAVVKSEKHSKEDSLSAEDFKKNKEVYMDIINQISPEVISYIDNMEFDFSKTVTAALLVLRMNDVIKFGRDNIEILKEPSEIKNYNFSQAENYVFSCIKEGKVFASKKKLNELIIEETKEKNLIRKNTNEKLNKSITIMTRIMSALFCLWIVGFFISFIPKVEFIPFFPIVEFISWFSGVFLVVFVIATFTYFCLYNSGEYERTEIGNDINKKIEGLKNYIKEYSLLHEKNSDAIEIWDEFYIYYAMFQESRIIIIDHLKYIRIKQEI